jgi:Cu-Zn family superoxide dismutase
MLWIAPALMLVLVTVGCAKKESAESADAMPVEAAAEAPMDIVDQAVAELELAPDRVSAGMVSFSQEAEGVKVVAHIVGAPAGTLGLHVHDIGDCSAADFTSAGGHFNPTDAPHGGPEDAERHAGDLGNIVIGEDGSGHMELISDMLSLGEDDNSVIGRAVILHEKEDDLASQPTGAAGSRLACGVVEPKLGV